MLVFYILCFILEVFSYILNDFESEIISKNCITEITNKYFIHSATITIFITNSIKNETGIKEIYNLSVRRKNYNNFNVNFNEHDKKYALIISENYQEIILHNKQLDKLALWNARANFIFYLTKNISDSDLQKFIIALWDKYIMNVIILTPINNETLNIYSYFPYSEGNCGQNIKFELMGICHNGKLQKNINLFRNPIPNQLNGCQVNIRAIVWPPYVLNPAEEIQNDKTIYFEDGIEIKITDTVAQYANFTINYSSTTVPQDWGLVYPNGTTTGSMNALTTKKADLSMGSMGPTLERHMYLDYAFCHVQDDITCCVPKAQALPKWRNLLDTFDTPTWLCLIVTYFIVATTIWLLCKIKPQDVTSYVYLNNSFNFVFSIFLSISAKEVPQKRSGRILFFLWIIFSLHFVIAYQAKLISVLTHPNFEKQIDTFEEMFDSDLTFVGLPTLRRFFGNTDDWRVVKILNIWQPCLDSEKCLNMMARERNLAIVTTKKHMIFDSLKYVDSSGEPLIHCFGNSWVTYPSEIFMTRGFPLRDKIDTWIVRIRDTGLVLKWEADITRIWKHRYMKSSYLFQDDNSPLTLSHLEGAFFVSGIGWCVSVLVFFIEILVGRLLRKSK